MNACENLGESHARGVLLSKGIKIKRQRLREVLKCLKQSQPANMSTIRHRLHQTRTANSK